MTPQRWTDAARLNWLFLDLNSYFASVEQQDEPALRGKPIIVAPVMSDTSFAIAASYEARAFGVRTGTRIGDARRMCPGLISLWPRHDRLGGPSAALHRHEGGVQPDSRPGRVSRMT